MFVEIKNKTAIDSEKINKCFYDTETKVIHRYMDRWPSGKAHTKTILFSAIATNKEESVDSKDTIYFEDHYKDRGYVMANTDKPINAEALKIEFRDTGINVKIRKGTFTTVMGTDECYNVRFDEVTDYAMFVFYFARYVVNDFMKLTPNKIALQTIRKYYPKTMAQDILGVQPMTGEAAKAISEIVRLTKV